MALAFISVVLLLGGIIYLSFALAPADTADPGPPVVVIEGTSCHFLPVSCLGPAAASTPLAAPDGAISIGAPALVHVAGGAEDALPAEAFVLVHVPPPKDA
jgi:hypothetical protein